MNILSINSSACRYSSTAEIIRTWKLARHGPGFTLIELLVVISIIALLISILLPTLSHAEHQAKSVVSASNLRQIGIAEFAYAGDHNGEVTPDYFIFNQWQYGLGPSSNPTSPPVASQGLKLLTDRDYVHSPKVFLSPLDNYFVEIGHGYWPAFNPGPDVYSWGCSYAEREEQRPTISQIVQGSAISVGQHIYHLHNDLPSKAFIGDLFIRQAIPVKRGCVNGNGWNMLYFDGSVSFVKKTNKIWNKLSWDYSLARLKLSWEQFDRL